MKIQRGGDRFSVCEPDPDLALDLPTVMFFCENESMPVEPIS